jgi:DNA-binding CsgD family transcriptional regulator
MRQRRCCRPWAPCGRCATVTVSCWLIRPLPTACWPSSTLTRSASSISTCARYSATRELLPTQVEELHRAFWEHFWDTMSCSFTERVSLSRGEEDRSAAVLLQPHICQALRLQARREAAQLLTARQLELLQLAAAGLDNAAIARQLVLSRGAVRKHLENAYARLGVSSRTAAAARAFPDTT